MDRRAIWEPAQTQPLPSCMVPILPWHPGSAQMPLADPQEWHPVPHPCCKGAELRFWSQELLIETKKTPFPKVKSKQHQDCLFWVSKTGQTKQDKQNRAVSGGPKTPVSIVLLGFFGFCWFIFLPPPYFPPLFAHFFNFYFTGGRQWCLRPCEFGYFHKQNNQLSIRGHRGQGGCGSGCAPDQGNKWGAASWTFKLWISLRLSSQKTLKISNTIQRLHFSSKREKSRIKQDVLTRPLCIRGKSLLHEYLLYPKTGKSQYLQSGLPWTESFLGNSKCDHTWEQPGKKKAKSDLWSSRSVSLHILKNNRGKRSKLFPTSPISLGKQ